MLQNIDLRLLGQQSRARIVMGVVAAHSNLGFRQTAVEVIFGNAKERKGANSPPLFCFLSTESRSWLGSKLGRSGIIFRFCILELEIKSY
jgi:hypothetical protein